ncbi:bifunctional phosphoserine phosphatase/homoserine phosphotransferase ThrH [uncultured Endozoicomonas sp.]|uniref:bifunctional phosphoserine phosphatase/homoserine phosphotransferase ThrH n=1 Tax=uncultured Endozoicomonas sp. TaxID=432652 RepID=UPI00262DDD29|nr:bifunctional phosphoserine phosphatase/homoserine phosphotransferase ThrH [uncultured Endozoicomonas sp.]
MDVVCLDLEGVLIPEIWIEFATQTGIDELRATTRDIPDYDELMTMRLGILEKHGLGLNEIQEVISGMKPLEGAVDFVNWLRSEFQLIILSDTFYEFADPFMIQLGRPTLFCHRLEVDGAGKVTGYKLRQKDPKRASVKALKNLNYRVFAAGDSYNDTTMLSEADAGFLIMAPDNVIAEFPQYPAITHYDGLRKALLDASKV